MTQLLVSVRSAIEAIAAMQGGADWIDVKEPSRGSLGASDISTIAEVLNVVDGRRPVSAAYGELMDLDENLSIPPGLALVKCGLTHSADHWQYRWQRWAERLPKHCRPVLVAYAEQLAVGAPLIEELVLFALQSPPAGFLIDTAEKDGRSLLDYFNIAELDAVLSWLRDNQVPFAIAGSLSRNDLRSVMSLQPNWIAVRGAVCDGGRTGTISVEKVRQFKADITQIQGQLAAIGIRG